MEELLEKIRKLKIDLTEENENQSDAEDVEERSRGKKKKTHGRCDGDDDDDGNGEDNDDEDEEDEDISEACELAEEHPELEADFEKILDLLSSCWNDRERDLLNGKSTAKLLRWVEKYRQMRGTEHEEKTTVLLDFFALLGGVRLTYLIYQKAKAEIGEEVLTEDDLTDKEDDNPTSAQARNVLRRLRDIWMTGTDLSEYYAAALATTQYLTEVVRQVEAVYENTDANDRRRSILYGSLTLLHKFVRYFDVVDRLAELKLADSEKSAVNICAEIVSTSKEPELRLLALLTLSHIIDKDNGKHIDLLKADDELDLLLQSITEAFQSQSHRDTFGYKLEELLSGLKNLAENDGTSSLLIENGVLKKLGPILKDGDDEEMKLACDIMYTLALTSGNAEIIQKNKAILERLKELADHSDPSVQLSAQETLFVLRRSSNESDDKNEEQERSASPEPSAVAKEDTPKQHVMLSYSWKNKERVLWIRDKLKEHSFRVWIDVDDLRGNLKWAMAEAVENAAVVLVCVSKSYSESKNCKKEYDYADELGKPIIPLRMEDFKPRGWLGLSIAQKTYFDFSGKYPDLDKKFDELAKEIENTIKK